MQHRKKMRENKMCLFKVESGFDGKQTNKQTHKQTNKHTHKQTNIHTNKQTNKKTNKTNKATVKSPASM